MRRKQTSQDIKEQPAFTNPVWNGADPWMVKYNNEYIYCYSAGNSINVSKSEKMTKRGEAKKSAGTANRVEPFVRLGS